MRLPDILLKPRLLIRCFRLTLCIAGLAGLFADAAQPTVTHMLMQQHTKVSTIFELPAYTSGEAEELRAYEVELQSVVPFGWVDLFADDCLMNFSVNRRSVPIPDLGACHFQAPTVINLTPYLSSGKNTLDFTIRNLGGPMGFDARFKVFPLGLEAILKSLALVSLLALVMIKYGRVERWGVPIFWLALFSLLLSGIQYFSTPYTMYSNDIGGHVDYIRYLVGEGWLPPPTGWQSQQPPLYYFVAAYFYNAGVWLGMQNPIYGARVLSMLLYLSFLWLSLETIHLSLKGHYALLAAALVLFWPDGFTYAGRINNDSGMLMLNALTLYLAMRWYMARDTRWLRYAWYSALLGLAVKSSAVAGIGFMGVVTLMALWQKHIGRRFFADFTGWAIAISAVTVNFGRILYYKLTEPWDIQWFQNLDLAHTSIPPLDNTPYNLIYLDIGRFIKGPFAYSYPNDELFWNVFLKTLLLGEWSWQAPGIAIALSILFLIMLALIVAYLLRWSLLQRGRDFQPLCPPLVLFIMCMAGSVIAARINVPWTPQANSRYVCGMIVPMIIYFGKSVEWNRQQQRLLLAFASVGTAAVFCVLSVLLIMCEYQL